MQVLKCNNCGAKINQRTLKCDYCGSHYKETSKGVSEEKRRQSSFVIPKLSKEQLIISMSHLKTGAWVLIAPVLFMTLWCSIAGGAAINLMLYAETFFVSFVPLIMTSIGVVVLIGLIKNLTQDGLGKVIKLFKEDNAEKAYEIAKQKGKKNQHMLLISLLLAYHVFDDYAYLEANAMRATDQTIKSTTNYTNDYCILVEKYTAIK